MSKKPAKLIVIKKAAKVDLKSAGNIKQFIIVGVGASAGGLEAFTSFFKNLPPNAGMAFVVIQHLDPTLKGMLPELLKRATDMAVVQAKDNVDVLPNNVYVIPPNKSISILNGTLHLFEPIEAHGLRLPIDIFLKSLAADQQENSVGIILSGMGADGSLGLKAIKMAGGITLVQDPTTAKFDSMPANAIRLTNVDAIVSVEQLPERLISLVKSSIFKSPVTEIDAKTKNELDKIILLLREQTRHDFSQYKKFTLLRRIERRKGVHLLANTKDYIRFLQENPKEGEILFKELLIGVTSFFRDAPVWDYLKETILPQILERLPNGYTLRAWVAACSTGEEAYSLAIIFKEAIEKVGRDKQLTLQIFATDIDIDAVNFARKAIYSNRILADVSAERMNRFFVPDLNGYRVHPSIREMVVFANHSLIKDPPFLKLDILTCRNLLIYLEPIQQKKIVTLFNYCLHPNGILVLGNAESKDASAKGFIDIDSKLKIFKRSTTNFHDSLIEFPNTNFHKALMKPDSKPSFSTGENLQQLTDQVLLDHFAPTSILVNEKGDILYITGKTGKYIEPAAGKANLNIHAMARAGLREELPSAMRKAMKNYSPVIVKDILVGAAKQKFSFTLTVQQIEKPEPIKGMLLMIFNDQTVPLKVPDSKIKKGNKTQTQLELEKELHQVYETLKTTREEMQVSGEEAKSINEELQSTNEELQSTNEELTTSKEEMQSLNEELQTVNSELQIKINDLERATNDMKNLLRTTEIATLFLDKRLNIRRFTDSITNIFKLRESDVGRPFTDITNELNYPDLENHSKEVIKTLVPIETTIQTKENHWLRVKIVPYRTLDDRIDGLVITFTDITELEKLKADLDQRLKSK
jgi:two-component system CheB/CheR fusion protein